MRYNYYFVGPFKPFGKMINMSLSNHFSQHNLFV